MIPQIPTSILLNNKDNGRKWLNTVRQTAIFGDDIADTSIVSSEEPISIKTEYRDILVRVKGANAGEILSSPQINAGYDGQMITIE
jgi:hypothetical protein